VFEVECVKLRNYNVSLTGALESAIRFRYHVMDIAVRRAYRIYIVF